MTAIAVSTLIIMADPKHLDHPLSIVDLFLSFFFLCEVVVQAVAKGPKAYIANGWHRLDVGIVAGSVFGLVFRLAKVDMGTRVCRVVRSARPLRLVNRVESLHQTIAALITSLGMIGALVGFLLFSWFVWVRSGGVLVAAAAAAAATRRSHHHPPPPLPAHPRPP